MPTLESAHDKPTRRTEVLDALRAQHRALDGQLDELCNLVHVARADQVERLVAGLRAHAAHGLRAGAANAAGALPTAEPSGFSCVACVSLDLEWRPNQWAPQRPPLSA
jgi:hypothetical protein